MEVGVVSVENSGNAPEYHRFVVTGKVKQPIDVNPPMIFLGVVEPNQRLQKIVRWKAREKGPISVGIAQREFVNATIEGD